VCWIVLLDVNGKRLPLVGSRVTVRTIIPLCMGSARRPPRPFPLSYSSETISQSESESNDLSLSSKQIELNRCVDCWGVLGMTNRKDRTLPPALSLRRAVRISYTKTPTPLVHSFSDLVNGGILCHLGKGSPPLPSTTKVPTINNNGNPL